MSARLDEIASFLRGEDNTITLVRYHVVLNFGTSSKTGIASNIQLERNYKNEPKQYFYCTYKLFYFVEMSRKLYTISLRKTQNESKWSANNTFFFFLLTLI